MPESSPGPDALGSAPPGSPPPGAPPASPPTARGGSRGEVVAWASYDFANSAFTTLVVTFIFNQYFAEVIVGDSVRGGVIWGRAVTVSALIIALMMPVIGAIADFSGRKKRFLLVSTLLCVGFTAGLFWMRPGDVWLAAVIFVLANVAYEATQALYNAFLPEVATKENIGRVSGLGWGLGYIGGLICLALALGMVRGWLPDEGFLDVRATNLLVAGWFLVFSLPMFLVVRERAERRAAPAGGYARAGFRRVRETFRQLRRYREAMKLMVARMVYNDGLTTIFTMAAIYLGGVYGLTPAETLPIAVGVNLTAGVSAIGFGFVDDRIGGKKTILITLVVLLVAVVVAAWAPDVKRFWIAAILVGAMVGPNQAASRSLLGSFIPARKQGELFGLYAFSGKLASIAGPLAYTTVLAATGSHRAAMITIAGFFLVGLVLLTTVREEEGIALAEELSAETARD